MGGGGWLGRAVVFLPPPQEDANQCRRRGGAHKAVATESEERVVVALPGTRATKGGIFFTLHVFSSLANRGGGNTPRAKQKVKKSS